MAKKRSVGVEETENKARAEIRRFWLMFPPGGFYGDMPTGLGPYPLLNLSGFPHRGEITFCLRCRARPRKMRCGVGVSTANAIAKFDCAWKAH